MKGYFLTAKQARQFGQLESEEYTEDGIKVLAYVPKEIEGKL